MRRSKLIYPSASAKQNRNCNATQAGHIELSAGRDQLQTIAARNERGCHRAREQQRIPCLSIVSALFYYFARCLQSLYLPLTLHSRYLRSHCSLIVCLPVWQQCQTKGHGQKTFQFSGSHTFQKTATADKKKPKQQMRNESKSKAAITSSSSGDLACPGACQIISSAPRVYRFLIVFLSFFFSSFPHA